MTIDRIQRVEDLCSNILEIVKKQPTVEDIDRRMVLIAENVGNRLITEHEKICPANTNFTRIAEKTAENTVKIGLIRKTKDKVFPVNDTAISKWIKIIAPIIIAILGALGYIQAGK